MWLHVVIVTVNNSLEFFGTFRLSYVIAFKCQLTAHDLNKVLRKQTCKGRTNETKLEIMTVKLLVQVSILTIAGVTNIRQKQLLS